MKYFVIYCTLLFVGQALFLDVFPNKTGAQQVKDALVKAELESNLAAKSQTSNNSISKTNTTQENVKIKNFSSKSEKGSGDDLDNIIAKKITQLQSLRERHKELEERKLAEKSKETSKEKSNSNDNLTESIKTVEEKEKENSKLEEASDKKMVEMAHKLNKLVLKFQKKIGDLSHSSKSSDGSKTEEEDSTKKIARGNPATHSEGGLSPSLGGIDVNALSADDSNVKMSYKEDVKLEDRLALEAEEEKKVTNSDNFDDDTTAEAAAGVDKSSVATTSLIDKNSLTAKEQASQEMQSYNALISSESNRELTQIQDEINKATQSSMGKVSVEGQRENVQTESPTAPGLPGLGGEEFGGGAGATGGLEGLLNGGGGGAGGGDPLAAALAADNGGENDNSILSNAAAGSDFGASQATSISSDFGENQQQHQQPGNSVASLNLGGQTPIEVGSNTPVDMGMFGSAKNQQQDQGAENGGIPELMQSNLIESPQDMEMTGEQGFNPAMAFKKSKITKKHKKSKIHKKPNKFVKGKNYKRNLGRKMKTAKHH